MPIYEFQCEKCDRVVEKLCPMSTESIECECTQADSKYRMYRRISLGSFQLKGTGWYQTDFKGQR